MENKPAKELKNSITKLSSEIDQLKSMINTCDKSSKAYNRLIIERADARQKLREQSSKNIVSFFCKKTEQKSKHKRICDYFNQ